MNRTKILALLAGAAMSAGVANAQTANNSALERELLADAGARASFQAGGSAGHDGQFFIGDASGNNRLEIGGYMQFRYTLNNRDTTSPDEDLTNGFDMTRTALEFGGNVVNSNLGYYIRGYFDTYGGSSNGGFELADAYGTYTFDSGLTVIWGQMIAPITRERMVDDRYQLAADRSITGDTFSAEYVQGIAFAYAAENWKVVGSFNDGGGTANTAYYSAAEADYALTGRVEFKWSGDWAQFDDFTSWRGTEGYAGMVGGAVHWQTAGDTANTTSFAGGTLAGGDLILYTADVSLEGNGWNAFGAFIGRTIDPDGASSSTDDFGAIIQGGVFVSDNWELFGRWDGIFPDDDSTSGDDYHTITLGANHYFFPGSHAAKFTADVQIALENQSGASAVSGFSVPDQSTGLLPTAGTDDNQWMLRLQMQLVF